MKSIFRKAIVAIFGAMMVCGFANAQGDVTIILEAHDVWKDGSGYQLLLDKDHNTYGTVIPEKQLFPHPAIGLRTVMSLPIYSRNSNTRFLPMQTPLVRLNIWLWTERLLSRCLPVLTTM